MGRAAVAGGARGVRVAAATFDAALAARAAGDRAPCPAAIRGRTACSATTAHAGRRHAAVAGRRCRAARSPRCMASLVTPLGRWVVADLSVGVVWFNAMEIVAWAAVWLAGWGAQLGVRAGRRLPVRRAGAGLRAAAHVRADHGRARRRVAAGGGHRCRATGPVVRGVDAGRVRRVPGLGAGDGVLRAVRPGRRAATSPAACSPSCPAWTDWCSSPAGGCCWCRARRWPCRCSSAAAPARCCRTGCGRW